MLSFYTGIAQTASQRRMSSPMQYTGENISTPPFRIRKLLRRTLEWTNSASQRQDFPYGPVEVQVEAILDYRKTRQDNVQDNRWQHETTVISFGPKLRYDLSLLHQQKPPISDSARRNPGVKTSRLPQILQLLIQQRNRRKHFALPSKFPWQ